MRTKILIGAAVATAFVGVVLARSGLQSPALRDVDEKILREYTGAYRWGSGGFVYLQLWNEFSGFDKPAQLVAFDEDGLVRVLYPTAGDEFFAGPGAAVPTSVEARISFQRDNGGKVTALEWQRQGEAPRAARRAASEQHEDVRFANGDVRLAGTLISPTTAGRHPAVILVHGSGAENREYILPFARFLVRRGVAVLGYDKRGAGESTGDWKTASFDVLAGDVSAAVEYLKTRRDIDPAQIGLLGVSQAGWVMPLAAVRAKDMAFLISISGAAIPAAETTIDQARNEMTAAGMKPGTVAEIVAVIKLQYEFARTGQGWDDYAAARSRLASKIGRPPDTIPGTPDHPFWRSIQQWYFYDPGPTLRQLRVPVLAIFGELDNNIVAAKHLPAWESALKAGGHPDYTLRILPKANHYQWEAKTGSNAEMASLQRFVPEYFKTIDDWLAKRVRGFGAVPAR